MDLTLITYNGGCAIKPNLTKPISQTVSDNLSISCLFIENVLYINQS